MFMNGHAATVDLFAALADDAGAAVSTVAQPGQERRVSEVAGSSPAGSTAAADAGIVQRQNTEFTSETAGSIPAPRSQLPKIKGPRLPLDWRPTERDLAYAAEHGISGDSLKTMARAFRIHHTEGPGAKKHWKYPAPEGRPLGAWVTWVDNDAKFFPNRAKGGAHGQHHRATTTGAFSAADRYLREAETEQPGQGDLGSGVGDIGAGGERQEDEFRRSGREDDDV